MINSKQKGKRGELDAVHFLKKCGFVRSHRSQQYKGSSDSGDVVIPELPLIHVEVKYRYEIKLGGKSLNDACMQSARDANGEKAPVVMWRSTGDRQWKMTYLDTYMESWPTVANKNPIINTLFKLNSEISKRNERDNKIQPLDCVTAKMKRNKNIGSR